VKGIFELNNGGGLFGKFNKTVWLLTSLLTYLNEAREFDSKACKAIWDFEGKSIVPYRARKPDLRYNFSLRDIRHFSSHPRSPLCGGFSPRIDVRRSLILRSFRTF